MRIIVGITGATGVIMGYKLLVALRQFPEVETHLIVSKGAKVTLALESNLLLEELYAAADVVHEDGNLGASISSGSFKTDGMVVIPCSMKTLSAIAMGFAENLIVRAADVCLKEGRKVVLVPREMPLGKIHCRNMLTAAENGCVIVPPVLTFYNESMTIDGQIDHIIGKILMQFGLDHERFKPWEGVSEDEVDVE